MPRPKRPWFRFYVEAIYDPKLRRLPPGQRWLWPTVMALARQSPVPGHLLISAADEEVEALTEADLVDAAAMTTKEVKAALAAFYRLGMMHTDDELDCMVVTKFNSRQFESDDVTERTRRHRAQKSEPPSLERSNGVPGNAARTAGGTPPETEAETDTDTHSHPQQLQAGDDPPADDDEQQRAGRTARARAACDLIGDQAFDVRLDAGKVQTSPAGYRRSCRASAHRDHLEAAQQLAHQHPDATPEQIAGEILQHTPATPSNGARQPGELDPKGLYAAADEHRLALAAEGPAQQNRNTNLGGIAAARAALTKDPDHVAS